MISRFVISAIINIHEPIIICTRLQRQLQRISLLTKEIVQGHLIREDNE